MVLTDPTFFERIGPEIGPWIVGPRRLAECALRPEEVPPLTAVLLSHAHFDSLDRPSLRRVSSGAVLVTPVRTADLVDDLGFARVVELDWGQTVALSGDVTVEAIEVAHWGKRWPWDRWRGYNGYVLRKGGVGVLFVPDTAYTPRFKELAARSAVQVAIIGNGAYDPWIWNHANPEQVWQMFRESGASALIPIHFDTFRLGREPRGDALRRLLAAAGSDADQVVLRRTGETWSRACCEAPQ
jgi:L-ascorbate metabolism protein UlaG (beta-lactamase superfamily)